MLSTGKFLAVAAELCQPEIFLSNIVAATVSVLIVAHLYRYDGRQARSQ